MINNMIIKKYNSMTENDNGVFPYELTNNGELKKIIYSGKKTIYTSDQKVYTYLTDEQFDKLKNISGSTKTLCDLLDEEKRLRVMQLKAAINKVKNDPIYYVDKQI